MHVPVVSRGDYMYQLDRKVTHEQINDHSSDEVISAIIREHGDLLTRLPDLLMAVEYNDVLEKNRLLLVKAIIIREKKRARKRNVQRMLIAEKRPTSSRVKADHASDLHSVRRAAIHLENALFGNSALRD